ARSYGTTVFRSWWLTPQANFHLSCAESAPLTNLADRAFALVRTAIRSRFASIHRSRYRRGRNTVCHHGQGARARFGSGRDIEVSRDSRRTRGHTHRAMTMGAGIENMTRCLVGYPDQ